MRGREEVPVCLACAALFLSLLNFDSLCLLLRYVSLLPGGFAIRWEGQLETLEVGAEGWASVQGGSKHDIRACGGYKYQSTEVLMTAEIENDESVPTWLQRTKERSDCPWRKTELFCEIM